MTELVRSRLGRWPAFLTLAVIILGLGYLSMRQCWPLGSVCLSPKVKETNSAVADADWAKKLSRGGYILHIRHAQRDKWANVAGFDVIERITTPDMEKASFRAATCLSNQGVEEAKLIGTAFRLADVNIGRVYSSPSCRAKQTAMLAFGRIDETDVSLMQRTTVNASQHKLFGKQLRSLIDSITVKPDSNVILSGHGATLDVDRALVVDVNETGKDLDAREETGIVVLEKVGGHVIARHTFRSITSYIINAPALAVPFKRAASAE